ncbi:N-acetylglucosamine kinase [Polymorphospora lycopeni]|uniref:BadF/BadG/BcrA/BcrD ATPase family protein n=1 Tax=Polymorphospora lycopeni TaxID=3140240 RepID=A0ABV5CNZ1_9ACTN
MSESLVVGLDIGGTSTRALVATTTGTVLGRGRAGGGNPTTHGADAAAGELRLALTAALAPVDPGRVSAAAMGLAGAGRLLADPVARAAFDRVWDQVGLRCGYDVTGDALAAYASGTPHPDGSIVIAGTGAIAGEIRDLTLHRVADGHGWLLGDAGSGFWLGREAVRRTLAAIETGQPRSGLPDLVMTELLGDPATGGGPRAGPARRTVDALVQAVTARPPIALAALAPLVVRAARADDPVAADVIATAARLLAGSVGRIRGDGDRGPIVLGGGLLTGDTPLSAALGDALRERWPAAPLVTAGDGAAGAAWLAARTLPDVTDPAALHHRLLGAGVLP